MGPEISIKNRLYLKQVERSKMGSTCEVLPLEFNYQDLVIVETGVVESVVFQTHSCGCGPQPTINGGFLEKIIPWCDSMIRKTLMISDAEKDLALVDQKLAAKVYVVRKARTREEEGVITKTLQGHFGENKKISFF